MKKQNQPIKVALAWLKFAMEDYDSMELIYNSNSELYRTICFHAQQFIEKILKGILEEKNIAPPRTHDINVLVRQSKKSNVVIPLTEQEIHFLSSIYIDSRYPPDIGLIPDGEPNKQDSQFARNAALKMHEWVSV